MLSRPRGAYTGAFARRSRTCSHQLISLGGTQTCRFDSASSDFVDAIAPARTFGFLRDVDQLRAVGLARGGSVENCIVLDDETITNGPLRFEDEFVRHKILDLLGDLILIGRPVNAEISAHKAGHAMHSRLVEALLAQNDSREEGTDRVEAPRQLESFF